MKATNEVLAALLQMQHIDLEARRAQKKLEELPQRTAILDIRRKKQTIESKHDQVSAMRKKAEGESMRIRDEDERLAAKELEVQGKIAASKGDYRNVEALSKELNGVAKRRATLVTDGALATENLAQIEGVSKQVTDALEKLATQESQLIASFQKEGGALGLSMSGYQKERETLSAMLEPDMLAQYEKILIRGGGIAVARLQEGACSVCRNVIIEGRFLQVQAEAPLSTCPFCNRMLVVA